MAANWLGYSKRRAAQVYNLGRHSVKFSVSLLVNLRQTVTELCASMRAAPVSRTFMQNLVAFLHFCNRQETASDVHNVVSDKSVKFGGSRLRNSTRNRRRRHFYGFFRDNFRPEVYSNVVSGVAVEYVGTGVPVQFGDAWPNCSRDKRLPHFVTHSAFRITRSSPQW